MIIKSIVCWVWLSVGTAPANALPVDPPMRPAESLSALDSKRSDNTSDAPFSDNFLTQREGEDTPTLLEQLVQTALGLGVVVALIYLFGRVVLPRTLKLKALGSGKHMRVVERLQLDPKNALLLVESEDYGKLLLGLGERGPRLLCRHDALAGETQASDNIAAETFDSLLSRKSRHRQGPDSQEEAPGEMNDATGQGG